MQKNYILVLIYIVFNTFIGLTQEKNSTKNKFSFDNWFEKSSIQPKKHILSILVSNNQYPLILQGPSTFLEQNLTQGFRIGNRPLIDAVYLNYQYSLKHHFFVETGFKYIKHYIGYKANRWFVNSAGTLKEIHSTYSTLSFDIGTGYRIIVNNNLRLFDVHTGVSLGFTDNKIGAGSNLSSSSTYIDAMGNVGTVELFAQQIITNRFNLGFYLGLSKDIRVTDNLYLTARYNNHFGKKSVISESTIYYSLSTVGIVNVVKANTTAKGKMYAVGLRWIF